MLIKTFLNVKNETTKKDVMPRLMHKNCSTMGFIERNYPSFLGQVMSTTIVTMGARHMTNCMHNVQMYCIYVLSRFVSQQSCDSNKT